MTKGREVIRTYLLKNIIRKGLCLFLGIIFTIFITECIKGMILTDFQVILWNLKPL
jgi:hypothetical protein